MIKITNRQWFRVFFSLFNKLIMKQCMVMRNKNTEVAQMKRVWDGSRLIGWWKIERTAVWLIKDTGDTFWNIMVFVWYI